MIVQQTTQRSDVTRVITPSMHALTGLALALLATACSGEGATGAGSSVTTTNPADGTPGNGTGTNGNATNGTGTQGTTSGTPVGSDNTDLGLAPGEAPVTPIGETCIQEDVTIATVTPTVELLIDRSGSMNANFGAGTDRWNTIRNVLVNPTDGVVKQMESKVRFGLTLYTGYMTEADTAATCPNLVEQPIGLNNFMPIQTTFMANEIFGQASTPSAEGIAAATAKLEVYPEMGPKVLVFATDGDPDTCADPDSNGMEGPRMGSEAAVQAAWTKGISTYVIAVGDDITGLQHMTNLAKIGQGGDPAATYFQASDPTALVGAFNTIVRGLISCDFNLNGTVLEANAASGMVLIDGLAVPYGDPNGWVLVGESTVRLQGTACDTLKIQVTNVDINFPCGTVMLF